MGFQSRKNTAPDLPCHAQISCARTDARAQILPCSLRRSRQHGDARQVAARGGSTTRLCYKSLRCARLDRTCTPADLLLPRPRAPLLDPLASTCLSSTARARTQHSHHSHCLSCHALLVPPRTPPSQVTAAGAAGQRHPRRRYDAARAVQVRAAPTRRRVPGVLVITRDEPSKIRMSSEKLCGAMRALRERPDQPARKRTRPPPALLC